MKISSRITVLAAVIIAIVFVMWRVSHRAPVGPDALEACLAQTFEKHGLTDRTLVAHSMVEKRLGRSTYYRLYAEYDLPGAFSWRKFQASVKGALKKTPFHITKIDRRAEKNYDVYSLAINRGNLNLMELKVRRKKAAAALPPIVKAHKKPKVAIVVDDFGYNMNNVEAFLDIRQPLTLSILPNQPYSEKIANLARSRGYEVILHLPLEARRRDVDEEAYTIKSGMDAAEIEARVQKELADVPGADGVSNHQGSKSTEDRRLMAQILACLKKENLFFFDSLTSPRSVCRQAAAEAGVRYARRDIFLDNVNDAAAIEKQLTSLRRLAFKYGKVTAICHDRKNTVIALGKMMPEMAGEGIEFVYLSEMVK